MKSVQWSCVLTALAAVAVFFAPTTMAVAQQITVSITLTSDANPGSTTSDTYSDTPSAVFVPFQDTILESAEPALRAAPVFAGYNWVQQRFIDLVDDTETTGSDSLLLLNGGANAFIFYSSDTDPTGVGSPLPPGFVLPPVEVVASETITIVGTLTPVPEPTSIALLSIGGLGLAGYAYRRRKQQAC